MNLSKREQIAAMAMAGLMSDPRAREMTWQEQAVAAVKAADALIAELDRTAKEQQP